MDTRSLSKLLQYLALPFMAASLFQKPLGLNEWAQPILGLIAVAFLWSGIWLQRRAKKRSGESVAVPTSQQRRNRLVLCIVLILASSLTGPLWLPFLGPHLPLPRLVVVSVITCVVALTILFIAARRWPKA